MKKVIASAALLLGLVSVKAQAQHIELIPKAGINIANQAIGSVSSEKSKIGFQGGIGVNFYTKVKNFSIMPELNFVNKGVTLHETAQDEKYNLNYLEVPVLAQYHVGPLYLNAGPSVGYLLNPNDKATAEYGELRKFDFGVKMGAGLAIPVGTGKVIVDGRYELGLNNISKIDNVKNRGIQLSVGYALPL